MLFLPQALNQIGVGMRGYLIHFAKGFPCLNLKGFLILYFSQYLDGPSSVSLPFLFIRPNRH